MIFGFNTDIKVNDTVYHVQSEARTAEKLLQTQVFVKGYCIGKRAASYANEEASGQTEESRHELLRSQHRNIVQAIREGHLDTVIESGSQKVAMANPPAMAAATGVAAAPATKEPAEDSTPSSAPPTVAATAGKLELKFLGSDRPTEHALHIRFSVSMAGVAAEGATLQAQIVADNRASATFSGTGSVEAQTGPEGLVELSLPLPPNPQGEASLVVQVHHAGTTASKKFRIKTKAD